MLTHKQTADILILVFTYSVLFLALPRDDLHLLSVEKKIKSHGIHHNCFACSIMIPESFSKGSFATLSFFPLPNFSNSRTSEKTG